MAELYASFSSKLLEVRYIHHPRPLSVLSADLSQTPDYLTTFFSHGKSHYFIQAHAHCLPHFIFHLQLLRRYLHSDLQLNKTLMVQETFQNPLKSPQF